MTLNEVLPLILGAGGAGFIVALVQSVEAWRNGAEAREGKAIANLERWRDEADARSIRLRAHMECEQRWGNYWRGWAGTLEYLMAREGVPLPPRPPEPSRFPDPASEQA